MAVNPMEIVFRKTKGFVEGLENMTEHERIKYPSREYGENFNNIRKLVLESHPDLAPAMPPEASFRNTNGIQECAQSYREFQGWGKEVYNMLIQVQGRGFGIG